MNSKKQLNKIRTKKFKLPIFFNRIKVVICNDFDKIGKRYEFNEKGLNNYGAFYNKKLNKNGILVHYVCFRKNAEIDLIVHEIVHLVNGIFLATGIKLNRKNDETQAYITAFLVKKISKFLYKDEINKD